jgi:4-amino-4-deoxy-L-arabinose transferase-like glycosyltransferase
VLSWDEAWNTLTVQDGARGYTADGWFYGFYRHPPAYIGAGIGLAWLTGSDPPGIAVAMERLSLLFALGTVVLVFLCGKEWFDERVGLLAALIYALLPAARVFDVFIKPDAATAFFGMLFLYLFFKKKHLLAGVFLGLAFLSKETAVFILAPAFLYLLVSRQFRESGWLVLSSCIAAAVSAWWYLAYSVTRGDFINFFLGRGQEAKDWHQSWRYYFTRLPSDLGWVVLALLVLALFMWALRPGRDGRGGMSLFLLLWLGVTYAVLSASFGKPPWMTYTVYPAAALLAGWGAFRVVDEIASARGREFAYASLAVVMAAALALSLSVGFGGFMRKADSSFSGWISERAVAEYLNSRGASKVMIGYNDQSPNLMVYLRSYDPRRTAYFGRESSYSSVAPDATVIVLDPTTDQTTVEQRVLANRPDYFVARMKGLAANVDEFATVNALQGFVKGTVLQNAMIFDGRRLADAIGARR